MANSSSTDLLEFADEEPIEAGPSGSDPWSILIVDDDEEVHAVTKLALSGFEYAGRGLEFLSAYSGEDARRTLESRRDIALVLLDVVMESEHSGLNVVRFIREQLADPFIRIVLRTGQPGQAPERRVVREYDINDYKEKTELTSHKLYTCVYTALGAYRALVGLEANRRGLVKVIEASTSIFEQQSIQRFTQGVLEQVAALLYLDQDCVYVRNLGITNDPQRNRQVILAATAEEKNLVGRDPREVLAPELNERIQQSLRERSNLIGRDWFTGYVATRTGTEAVLYVASETPLTIPDKDLLDLFFRNVTIGLENLNLRSEIEATQQELVYILGDAVESRCKETGNHVRRVGEYSKVLALLSGLGENEAEILLAAAPLHDVGKIAIPDSILNHPGRLDPPQWEEMKTHTWKGAKLLRRSNRPILQAGAIIAEQHHENWDGSGYPKGLSGSDIHIYGRIVALADVFDALGSNRCYKHAWELNQVLAHITEQRGGKFDPQLVDLFLANTNSILEIRRRFPDPDGIDGYGFSTELRSG